MTKLSLSSFASKVSAILPAIMREMSRRQIREFYKIKITIPQFIVLDFLNRRGDSKMTDMSKFLGVTLAAVTGIMDRLVRDGYVLRESDADDRRIVKIRLRTKGSRLAKKIVEKRRRMIIDMFRKAPEKDREDYLRILTNIYNILTQGKKGRNIKCKG